MNSFSNKLSFQERTFRDSKATTTKPPLVGQKIRTDVSPPSVESTSTMAAALADVKFTKIEDLNV